MEQASKSLIWRCFGPISSFSNEKNLCLKLNFAQFWIVWNFQMAFENSRWQGQKFQTKKSLFEIKFCSVLNCLKFLNGFKRRLKIADDRVKYLASGSFLIKYLCKTRCPSGDLMKILWKLDCLDLCTYSLYSNASRPL